MTEWAVVMASSGPKARVLIADDHPVYREGVARALREHPDLELVAECGDAATALTLIEEHRPDVALLDLRMPGRGGMHVLERLRVDPDAPRAVILSAYHDPETVHEALLHGAATYLSKSSSRAAICAAVARVARGEVVLNEVVTSALTAELQDVQEHATLFVPLTSREQEVLELCADGLRAPAIARELHLGTSTVKSHLASLYRKLGARDRAAAVAIGYRQGLVS